MATRLIRLRPGRDMLTARALVVVCAVLGSIRGVAQGQAPPAAPQTPATPAPGAAAQPPSEERAAQAARAKAAGELIEVTSNAAVAGCRDLGEAIEQTPYYGAGGEIRMRTALKA